MSRNITQKSEISGEIPGELVDEIATQLVGEIFQMLEATDKKDGQNISMHLFSLFLTGFVGTAVSRVLNKSAENRATLTDASNDYALVKGTIQEAVSSGFAAAMSEFSGKHVDYHCAVSPIADSANRTNQPC